MKSLGMNKISKLLIIPILLGYFKLLKEIKCRHCLLVYFLSTLLIMFVCSLFLDIIGDLIAFVIVNLVWLIVVKLDLVCYFNPKAMTRAQWFQLDGWQFEEAVAEVLRNAGYKKVEVTKGSGDGGVDLIFYKDGIKYIGQCKRYMSKVGPEPVRALWGVKGDFKADKVVMIATSGVTIASKKFIDNKKDYILWTLDDIVNMSLVSRKEKE